MKQTRVKPKKECGAYQKRKAGPVNETAVLHKIVTAAVLIIAVFFTSVLSVHAQPLRIAYPKFPPFHWVDDSGKMTGFFYEIITEALEKRMGVTVVWTAYPWTRCQENLKRGIDDAILTVPTAERAEYTATHKEPFYRKELHIYTYANHQRLAEIKRVRTIEDLKRGGFSVITYSGNGWHKENVESLGIKTYETAYLRNVWIMLANKRGEIVIEWPPGAWPDIRRTGVADQIIDTGITVSSMPFHLLVRKKSPYANRLDEFDKIILKMTEDGTIQSILSNYDKIFREGISQ
jgi:polar amino acid transport system substrate-binding protein